ncbi:sensor histidine kinase [Cellulosilyticum sp. I15G10I2]|uniref:sensor histidine kinase n=1 Tax=Cellulosilyticum sp. I15G10I2 TaxID=1892843 RepID=UPI00085CB2A6|nr:histidine kinase [Cellulosilyticum sp. I15G10I2]
MKKPSIKGLDIKSFSLKKQLLVYFFIIILIMSLTNISFLYKTQLYYESFDSILRRAEKIDEVSVAIDNIVNMVVEYLYNTEQNNLGNYEKEYNKVVNKLKEIQTSDNEKIYYKGRDILSMVETFNEKKVRFIQLAEKETERIYIDKYVEELYRLSGYMQSEVKILLVLQMRDAQSYYAGLERNLIIGENIIYLLMFFITLLCFIFAIRFSRNIAMPIHKLAIMSKEVAEGNLDIELIDIKTGEEVSILVKSFNNMVIRLKQLIETIKQKGQIENELKQEQIKNLEVSHLLNKTELDLLQSQINPHFLFNTLNSISALAEIESAEQTKLMIKELSSLLWYNLKRISMNVTLGEEYKVVESYLYIQSKRFGNRFYFDTYLDSKVENFTIPSMILQPFVENAIIHGLEPKSHGILEISVKDEGQCIRIIIQDDGVGMDEQRLQEIVCTEPSGLTKHRGIGINNVIKRLNIAYGTNVVQIESELGKGTKVTILLPKV